MQLVRSGIITILIWPLKYKKMERKAIVSKFRLKNYVIDKSIFDYNGEEVSSERNIGFDVKGLIKKTICLN